MTDRAVTYNDQSILESYHVSKAFFLLKKSQNNWFKKLSRPIKRYLRMSMIAMVLATDMHFHFREVSRLQQMLAALRAEISKLTPSDDGSSRRLSVDAEHSLSTTSDRGSRADAGAPIGPIHPTATSSGLSLQTLGVSVAEIPLGISLLTGEPLGMTEFSRIPLQRTKAGNAKIMSALKIESPLCKTITGLHVLEDKVSARVSGIDDERLFMLSAAIHISDISNPSKELRVCDQWADRVMEEWFVQGDLEEKNGLPISPMMNRATASKPSGQIGFIKFIVEPLMTVFGNIVPEMKLPIIQLEENLEHWEYMREAHKTIRVERRASMKKGVHIRSSSDLARRIDSQKRSAKVVSPTTTTAEEDGILGDPKLVGGEKASFDAIE
jgi:hypothetical protein